MRLPFLLLVSLAIAAPGTAATLTGSVHWSGEVTIAEKTRVEPGAVLRIEPGTTVTFTAGGLEVAGRLQAEGVRFTGSNWSGILLKSTGAGTRLADCRVEGAATGIQVLGGAPRLERLVLTGNQVGMELRQKTAAKVAGCIFRGNAKVGLFVKDEATPEVTGCRFEKNARGAYIFRARPQKFTGNRFAGNGTALTISLFGSDPQIAGNRFQGNETGILVEKAARPVLTGNLLRDNSIGIRLHRRADARIEGNLLEKNRVGIEVAYSSYPLIAGNDLGGNGTALRLEHQSAAWEEANGAEMREAESARGAFGQGSPRREVSEADRRPRHLAAVVDARGNWWGEKAGKELTRVGGDGNLSFIHDGRDQATFTENGRAYPLDRALYQPWSPAPLTGGKIE